MKIYKKLFSLLVLLSALVFAVGYAQAAPGWFTCTVLMAGPGGADEIYIKLTDLGVTNPVAFTGKVFSVSTNHKNRALAVALTALTNGIKVKIYADPGVGTYPVIQTMYLLPPD